MQAGSFTPALNNFFLAIPAALVVTFIVGLVIERVLIRLYYQRPKEDQILVTYGLAIVLVEIVRAIFSGQTKLLTTPSWAAGYRANRRYRLPAVSRRGHGDRRDHPGVDLPRLVQDPRRPDRAGGHRRRVIVNILGST